MKKSLFLLGLVFSFVVFASKPRSGINDLADSRGTGVDNVQFFFGGTGESVRGAIDDKIVMQAFRSNIIGQYRCFAAAYGGNSKATGVAFVRMTMPAGATEAAPQQVVVDSKDLDSAQFLDCMKSYWSKVKMPAPATGEPATVVMPIRAQLRQLTPNPMGI